MTGPLASARGSSLGRVAAEHLDPLYNFALLHCRHRADAAEIIVHVFRQARARFAAPEQENRLRLQMFSLIRREAVRRFGKAGHVGTGDPLLAAVSEECRLPVVLYVVEQFTCAEVARILGCPVRTVRSRIRQGLDRLRPQVLRSTASSR